jgi:hypothetical protein
MPKLTGQQVAQLAWDAGFRDAGLVVAVEVSFAENGSHDTEAVNHNSNGTTDTGLWQINSVHRIPQSTLFDPAKNAAAAYRISSSGTDFTPWTTYKDGAARGQESAAQLAIQQAGHPSPGQGHTPSPTDLPGVGTAVHATESVASFLGTLGDRSTWIRIGEVVAGLALGIGGLFLLGRILIAEQAGGLVRSVVRR